MGLIEDAIKSGTKGFTKSITKMGDAIKSTGDDVLKKMADDIGKPITSIGDEFKKIPDKVFTPINEFLKKSVRDPILSLIDGIDDMILNFIRIVCFMKSTPTRFRNLGTAFDEVFNGVSQEFVALGYAFDLGFDSISSLVYYTVIFIDSYLGCIMKILSNSLECLPFYLMDVIGQIIYLPLRILLWVFDVFLGIDLYPTEKKLWKGIMEVDEVIYSIFGFNIARYPKGIRDNCYTCVALKSSVLSERKKNVDITFEDKIPAQLGKSKPTFDKAKDHFDEVFAFPHAREPKHV
jgi:hypothetical protein